MQLRIRGIAGPAVGLGLTLGLAGCASDGPSVGESSHAILTGSVYSPVDSYRFSSRIEPTDNVSGGPAICADVPCERIDVHVQLGFGIWNDPRTTGLEFSTQWIAHGDNLFMYVYKDGELITAEEHIIATAESVILPDAESGLYSIYMALDPESLHDEFEYEGIVEVEHRPQPNPPRPLLPDLIAEPQENITFDTPIPIFFEDPPPEPGETCNPTEVEEEGAQVCLRFDQILSNVGDGNLDVHFLIPHDPESPDKIVRQLVSWSDGSQVDEYQIDEWEFHSAHDHFHYKGFAQSRLWHANEDGERLDLASEGDKVSFCMVDIRLADVGYEGNGPKRTHAPDCLIPAFTEGGNDVLVSGITRGWTDVYDWYLPDQYIEVAGLPDGYYVMDTIVNPEHTIIESDLSNNCNSVLIYLEDVDSSDRSVTLIGEGPAC